MKDDKNPIIEHKERDVIELRTMLWAIINNPDTKDKDKVEAAKLLARMHHALQPDKVTVKDMLKDKSPFSEDEEKEILDAVQQALVK